MTVLLTAFEPFGGEAINPALEALRAVPDSVAGARVVHVQVPVVYGQAARTVCDAIARERPDAVLMVGQAGGRADIAVERVALNLRDAAAADNAGICCADAPIVPGAPVAYWASVPVRAMVAGIRAAGVPASLSYSAGTYVCNDLFYGVLHALAQAGEGVQAGFLHVPFLPEQAARRAASTPSMALADIVRGLCAAVEVVVRAREGGDAR